MGRPSERAGHVWATDASEGEKREKHRRTESPRKKRMRGISVYAGGMGAVVARHTSRPERKLSGDGSSGRTKEKGSVEEATDVAGASELLRIGNRRI